MIQEILVGILFAGALAYAGQAIYKQFQAKNSCATGCGKCGAVDFKKIEAELKSKGL